MKELAEEFEERFECLGENTGKYIIFQYQLKKNLILVNQLHTK